MIQKHNMEQEIIDRINNMEKIFIQTTRNNLINFDIPNNKDHISRYIDSVKGKYPRDKKTSQLEAS